MLFILVCAEDDLLQGLSSQIQILPNPLLPKNSFTNGCIPLLMSDVWRQSLSSDQAQRSHKGLRGSCWPQARKEVTAVLNLVWEQCWAPAVFDRLSRSVDAHAFCSRFIAQLFRDSATKIVWKSPERKKHRVTYRGTTSQRCCIFIPLETPLMRVAQATCCSYNCISQQTIKGQISLRKAGPYI